MRQPASRIRPFLPIAIGVAGAVALVFLWGQCNSGPPAGSLIVEGVDGWFLAVPDGVIHSSRASFGIKTGTIQEFVSFNFEIESIEFTTMGSAESGKWITKRNRREFASGEYIVRVTSGSDRETLVEATIVVDHDEEIQRVPHPLDTPDWRESGDFALFWLGEDFDRIPLRSFRELRHGRVDFIYGGCTIIGWNEGCAIPLSVFVEPCGRVNNASAIFGVRGAPAARGGEIVWVWTEDALVTIHAMSPKQALDAANSLVAVSSNEAGLDEDLSPSTCMDPPPSRSVVGTQLDCESLVGVEAVESISVTAVVTTFDGEPVPGAKIRWSGGAGDVEPLASFTDDSGRAATTYFADTSTDPRVHGWVNAAFDGNTGYAPSSCGTEGFEIRPVEPTATPAP